MDTIQYLSDMVEEFESEIGKNIEQIIRNTWRHMVIQSKEGLAKGNTRQSRYDAKVHDENCMGNEENKTRSGTDEQLPYDQGTWTEQGWLAQANASDVFFQMHFER